MTNTTEDKKFWDTDRGKIIMYFIHEHANAECLIGSYLELMKKDELISGYINDYIEYIKVAIKRQRDAVDYLYTKLKELEKID